VAAGRIQRAGAAAGGRLRGADAFGVRWYEQDRSAGIGLTVYGPGDRRPVRLFRNRPVHQVQVNGDLAYAASWADDDEKSVVAVVDLRTGRVRTSRRGRAALPPAGRGPQGLLTRPQALFSAALGLDGGFSDADAPEAELVSAAGFLSRLSAAAVWGLAGLPRESVR
jgi:hypothetical protein